MKTPRDLYGRDFADYCIRRWGYFETQQVGSHIILRSTEPQQGTVSIHAYKPLRIGTLNTLIRNVCEQRQVARDTVLNDLRS